MMFRLFPLKENPKTHSRSFSLMMSEMNEKSFKSPGALDSRRVEFPANSMSLAPTISTWQSFPSPFRTRAFSVSSI